jgi:CubicO group peptidase (beta-lactamase class C family)
VSTPLEVSIDRLASVESERMSVLLESATPSVAPAVAISVWHAGEPVFEASAGWMDPDSTTRPTPVDAIFDLASLSKLFTATAFLALVSDGRVHLDASVVSVIPEFGVASPRRIDGGQDPLTRRLLPSPPERADWSVDPSQITFRQLLTHTSGMAPWRSVFREAGPVPPPPDQDDPASADDRWRAGLDAVYGYPFVDRPGRAINYSDLGFMTLGAAVRTLSGAPLADAINDRIASPLGLESVSYVPLRRGLARDHVAPTSFDEDWRMRRCWGEVEDENASALGGVAGHAGLFGSAHDVAGFGQAWLEHDARLGLDDHLAAAAITDQTVGLDGARGLGWQVIGSGAEHLAPLGAGAFGHTGFTGTSLTVDPSRDLVVALLTNRVYAGRTHEGVEALRVAFSSLVAEVC